MHLTFPRGNDWKAWAIQLIRELDQDQHIEVKPVQLQTLDATNDKATTDGILMWNANTNKVVVSTGGAWVNV